MKKNNNENFKFYDSEDFRERLLEISDRHIFWEIYNDEITEDLLYAVCDVYLEKLEKAYKDLDIYLTGRSGRHICIKDNAINRRRYFYVKEKCEKLQDEMIYELNNYIEED